MECTYCGSDLSAYEPVYVEETVDCERLSAGGFCIQACLSTHIEMEELTDGDVRVWSPDE